MAVGKTVAGLIAIGIGCRRGCASEAIVALARRALAEAGPLQGQPRLFTIEAKRGEANLAAAARTLGLELTFLAFDRLAAQAPRALTRSARVEKRIGLPSLAETAALAGAGDRGTLIVARLAAGGATCAIAHDPGFSR
jgi:cobalt-precorrin 5A hydrolase